MVEYRRLTGKIEHKWHWITKCPHWPKSGEIEKKKRRPAKKLCDICLGMENDNKQ